jgi:putative oxidoreductase
MHSTTVAAVQGSDGLSWLLRTGNDGALTALRLALGVVMLPHGAQKALGWFGGPGVRGFVNYSATQHGIPAALAALVIAAEFLGGLGLVVGFLGRVAAFGILCDMVVAVGLVHYRNGFFMNWTGKQAGEGFEYHLLAIAIALVILLRGSGAISIDRMLVGH